MTTSSSLLARVLAPFLLLVCVTLAAQSKNATLQSAFKPNDLFSDVWGYVDPNTGKEYAILLGHSAMYFVDCSDPTNPKLRGTFSRSLAGWGSDYWRDARTYNGTLYIVADGSGADGMMIIDISNPDQPTYVKTYTVPGKSWRRCHNICIDLQTGLLYACGTGGGTHILDLNQDPKNPVYVTSYTNTSVHDLTVQDGIAYLSEYGRAQLHLLDVSNLPSMTTIGVQSIGACHNNWPTRDNQYCVVTSERGGGKLTICDIRNKNNPSIVATWSTGPSNSIPHNAYLLDRVVHMSYYTQGYRSIDISDPNNPVEVAYYDTTTKTGSWDGNWGCYPFQPSGNIYVSDEDRGLLVVRPKSASAAYGSASPGTGGVAPAIHTFGSPYIGNASFALECESTQPGAQTWTLVGAAKSNLTFAGLTLLVDTSIGITINQTANAAGYAVAALPIPNMSALTGTVLHTQAFAMDSGGPLGLSASAARTFELFLK